MEEKRVKYWIIYPFEEKTIELDTVSYHSLKKYSLEYRKGLCDVIRVDGRPLNNEEKYFLGKSAYWDIENDVIWIDRELKIGYSIEQLSMALQLVTSIDYNFIERTVRKNMPAIYFLTLKEAFNIMREHLLYITQ